MRGGCVFEQISKITTIPVLTLKKLFSNIQKYICHVVLENFLNKQTESAVDIGFGKLCILVEDDSVFFKFFPSQKFENQIINTIQTKESPLVTEAEDILVQKIVNTYKDLF